MFSIGNMLKRYIYHLCRWFNLLIYFFLQVHDMLHQFNGNASHDTDSTNSDSGKGPSEEGDPHDSITGKV